MALKIRMRKQGRTNHPLYRVVVTDSRNKRDGKYVESLGWYNPHATEQDKKLNLNADRAKHWISQGAVATDKAVALLKIAAPEVMKKQTEQAVAKKVKEGQKRKARAKKAAA